MPQERKGRNGGTLKSMCKGESSNPTGKRGSGKTISTILKELLDKKSPKEFQNTKLFKSFLIEKAGLTNGQAISVVLLYKAISKQHDKSITEILDRTEGKPLQAMDVTTGGEKITVGVINILPPPPTNEK